MMVNQVELANALSSVFADLKRSYKDVRYALEGDAAYQPPTSVVRKVLADFAKEAGKPSHAYMITKAYDEDPGFTRDLAITAAASYAKRDEA